MLTIVNNPKIAIFASMKFTAAQIAGILEGDIVGNPDVEVSKLAKIEEGTKGSLTFLANPKYNSYIYTLQMLQFA